jgi:hypothetical protein
VPFIIGLVQSVRYRVVLTLNTNGTYWARGSSCLKNKGDASGSGTWKLVEQKQPCAAYLKTTDGRRLCIGGPGATPDVAGFVQVLQEGQTYSIPETFQQYRKGRAAKP